MSWTRRSSAALAVCVLLLTGSAGCGTNDAEEGKNGDAPSPVGQVLENRDEQGRPYRQVDEEDAPDVGIEVQPDTGGSWDVRLALSNFRFSPPGAPERAAAGRGYVRLYLDGRPLAELRDPDHRLAARLVTRGTHQVTARLYADDGTVWAVDGQPVECTADITASGEESAPTQSAPAEPTASSVKGVPARSTASPATDMPARSTVSPGVSTPPVSLRIQGRGSPDPGGRAS